MNVKITETGEIFNLPLFAWAASRPKESLTQPSWQARVIGARYRLSPAHAAFYAQEMGVPAREVWNG